MKLWCLRIFLGLRNIWAIRFFQVSAGSNYTAIVPLHSLPPRKSTGSRSSGLCLRSSFWTTLLTGIAVISAFIFFVIQWFYQDWTAKKDFFEHCQSLQVGQIHVQINVVLIGVA